MQPLSLAAVNGNAAIIERLLKAGADANTALPGGETVLMTAARTGHVERAEGADRRQRRRQRAGRSRGQTALMWAAARDNADAVRVLVEAGADVNGAHRAMRPTAAGRRVGVGQHLPGAAADRLHARCCLPCAPARSMRSSALLEAGADVNDTLSDGKSALVVAAANAHWELADFLLDHGADPNSPTPAGMRCIRPCATAGRTSASARRADPTGTIDSIDVIKKMMAQGRERQRPDDQERHEGRPAQPPEPPRRDAVPPRRQEHRHRADEGAARRRRRRHDSRGRQHHAADGRGRVWRSGIPAKTAAR